MRTSQRKRAAAPSSSTASTTAPASKKQKMDSNAQKFYAVRAGFKPGVYLLWDECQRQINGFKGAQFKSFPTYEEAAAFAAGQETSSSTAMANPDRFYGLATGPKPGVYTAWTEVQKLIVGVKGPKYKRFNTRDEAEEFVRTYGGDKGRAALDDGGDDAPPKKKAKTAASAAAASDVPEDGMMRVYTDGSSLGNGKRGASAGVGVYFGPDDPRNISERLQGDAQTNQRAELTAMLRALEVVGWHADLEIVSDSKYSIQCVTEWYVNWEKNGWKTREGDVKNQDLVKAMREKIDGRESVGTKTKFTWVKGHSTDPGNIAADLLAVEGARKPM